MVRVSVQDCIDKLPNKFALVLLAAHRARPLASGPHIAVGRANDKNAVIALREIAAKIVSPGDVSEGPIYSMQHNAEGDEPESTVALTHEHPTAVGRDDRSTDPVIDALTGWRN
jgi:DNA-directed RNA polymerase subunit omega